MTDRLSVGRTAVARLQDGRDMAPDASPRPLLHPVTTLRGTPVTQAAPADHPHHAGVGLPFPDVDGTSYWGGRTYVRDVGSTLLANHGRQDVVAARPLPDGSGADLTVVWTSVDGTVQLRELRELRARPAGPGWVLDWRSVLRAETAVSLGSPATNGRHGAFYGGWFWRTPFAGAHAETAQGPGVERAHGVATPWLLVRGPEATLLCVQVGTVLPWFVRTEGYVGFGPAVAHTARRRLAAGEELVLHTRTLVTDAPVTDPAALAAGLAGAVSP
ncbi:MULTISPECIES: DUF6807 family protein [unclassified Actinotalea]|uniref:DUF6807 family protein n=1 Tax=unclassified Actinotalea TaxID=2638618 RepID=UPI001C71643C|nr:MULTISPECIES: DUF6807 family protein [unclassified Actinotalea]